MLSALHVENYVLIDSLEIDFPEGLVIITGQTGAGKSILLGALSLVLGAKADAGLIGSHGDNCVVEAAFTLPEDSPVRALLEENDLEAEEDGRLVIRRVIHRSGRSRSFVGDLPVTLPLLQALSAHLVDIHSQHQTLLVGDPLFQLRCLDLFAGNADALCEARTRWNALAALRRERAAIAERIDRLAAERDYNEARFRQLEAAKLRDGELEELEAEQQQLANAEAIKENLYAVQTLFSAADGAGESLDVRLKESERHLQKASRFLPDAAALAERLSAARIELVDILAETGQLNARTALNESRLEQVEQRLSLLYGLLQKFGCTTLAELIRQQDAYAAALSDGETQDERLREIDAAIAEEERAYGAVSATLHARRLAAAPALEKAIREALHFLELERAAFVVRLLDAAPGERGADAVAFRFSSTGGEPVDLARCASGGEMSRIMLSIKSVMAAYMAMPTMVFDEIDTGVSGSAADRMGRMICAMGDDMQLLAITHLPQVAAKGKAHYLVEKNAALTSIRPLDGEGRVQEIARLLSGSVVTEEALANARALLRG